MNEPQTSKSLEAIEYEQLSEDWRHRDALTWRIHSILILVIGIFVAQAFSLLSKLPLFVLEAMFALAALFALSMTIALKQNLWLQKRDEQNMKRIYSDTARFGFPLSGSNSLYYLAWALTLSLLTLNVVTISALWLPGLKQEIFGY